MDILSSFPHPDDVAQNLTDFFLWNTIGQIPRHNVGPHLVRVESMYGVPDVGRIWADIMLLSG